jgi:hypothetical protein
MGTWKGDSNPGGPGGSTRKIRTNVPRGKTSHRGGGGKPPKKECCPMVAAVRSVKQGKFKLAKRYAAMSARLIAARIA